MTTKRTLSQSSNHHLYQEVDDYSHVYMKIEKFAFKASNDGVMVQIPIKLWRQMIKDWEQTAWTIYEDNKNKTDEWLDSIEDTPKTVEKIKETTSIVKPVRRSYNTSSDETIIFERKK